MGREKDRKLRRRRQRQDKNLKRRRQEEMAKAGTKPPARQAGSKRSAKKTDAGAKATAKQAVDEVDRTAGDEVAAEVGESIHASGEKKTSKAIGEADAPSPKASVSKEPAVTTDATGSHAVVEEGGTTVEEEDKGEGTRASDDDAEERPGRG